jgi:hypothetical protein
VSQPIPPQSPYTPNYRTPAPRSDGLSGLIPYKNTPALISYYLGVFSLLPCIGAALGIAAVILGIIGLRKAAQFPEAKGKAHAIVGIVAGGVFGLAWIIVALVVIVAAFTHA